LLVSIAESPRIEMDEQAEGPHHASPFRSRGWVRAWSTIRPS
jgi:hypothetical protein